MGISVDESSGDFMFGANEKINSHVITLITPREVSVQSMRYACPVRDAIRRPWRTFL